MKMRANYVLVSPEGWPEAKLGSILLPDNDESKKKFARGTVIEVGPGLWLPNGERPPIEVSTGDHVLYFKAGAASIVVNEQNMHIVQEREILAILEPGDFSSEETKDAKTDRQVFGQ